MADIVIISGSPSAGSRLNGVLQSVEAVFAQEGARTDWIRVVSLPPEDLVYTRFDSPAVAEANRLIEKADGVVVATPIYKASYTGVLKAFLDLIPQKGLAGKAVLPIAIGGTIAHLLAIDYALKPVLSVLGARNQFQAIYAIDTQVKRNEDGSFEVAGELQERLRQAALEFVREVKRTNADAAASIS